MGMLVGWLVGAAWLWFVIVLFTQKHDYNWKEMLLWVVVEGLAAVAVSLPFILAKEAELSPLRIALSLVVRSVVVYLVLTFRFQVPGTETKLKILGVYLGVKLGVSLLLSFLNV